ncbi:MAG: hypothetical protein HYR96_14710 [Deltaproteobacteria bacterium]|nr:hypothetical protein [Deltaproteobacteria bacterium]MBI3294831.1 hypothetical protein [Deltaproteobacteria bacterium]
MERVAPDSKKVEKKLKLAADLFEFAYAVKRFQLQKKHPALSAKELNHLTYSFFEKGSK